MKKSPQIIGYVIENNDVSILKYYDPFFEAFLANYRWQFAIPTYKSNILDKNILESGVITSLISRESERPINKMKKNQFAFISFEIELSITQQYFNSF